MMSVSHYVCLCHRGKKHFLVDWRLLFKDRINNIGLPSHTFLFVSPFNDFLHFKFFSRDFFRGS